MKNKILAIHPITETITYKDLIDQLIVLSNDYKELQGILIAILKYQNWDDETISSLFKYEIDNRLDWIIHILKRLL